MCGSDVEDISATENVYKEIGIAADVDAPTIIGNDNSVVVSA